MSAGKRQGNPAKRRCKYDGRCKDSTAYHFEHFFHCKQIEWDEEDPDSKKQKRVCPHDGQCYRRSEEHWESFLHENQPEPLPNPASTSAAAGGSKHRPGSIFRSVFASGGTSSAKDSGQSLADKSKKDPLLRSMMCAASNDEKAEEDPYHLARFQQLPKHAPTFATALREIREEGEKTSHWSWFYILTSPWVQIGIEIGSRINKDYALRDCPGGFDGFEAARAFLDNPDLRGKLCEMFKAIQDQLFAKMEAGTPQANVAGALLGTDAHKLLSSVRLFYTVTLDSENFEGDDEEVNTLCKGILHAMNISEDHRRLLSMHKKTDGRLESKNKSTADCSFIVLD